VDPSLQLCTLAPAQPPLGVWRPSGEGQGTTAWAGCAYGIMGTLLLIGVAGLWAQELTKPVSYLGGLVAASPLGWFYNRTTALIGVQTNFWEGFFFPGRQSELKALRTGPLATAGCFALRACRKSMVCPGAWQAALCTTILEGASGAQDHDPTTPEGHRPQLA